MRAVLRCLLLALVLDDQILGSVAQGYVYLHQFLDLSTRVAAMHRQDRPPGTYHEKLEHGNCHLSYRHRFHSLL